MLGRQQPVQGQQRQRQDRGKQRRRDGRRVARRQPAGRRRGGLPGAVRVSDVRRGRHARQLLVRHAGAAGGGVLGAQLDDGRD